MTKTRLININHMNRIIFALWPDKLILYSSCLGNSTRVGKLENVSLLLDTMSMMLIEIFEFEKLLMYTEKELSHGGVTIRNNLY